MIGGGEQLLTLLLEGGDPFGGACRMVGGRPGLVRFAFGCFGFCHGSGLRVEAMFYLKAGARRDGCHVEGVGVRVSREFAELLESIWNLRACNTLEKELILLSPLKSRWHRWQCWEEE